MVRILSVVFVIFASFISFSIQQSLNKVLSSHMNLTSFSDLLTTSYPNLLSLLENTSQAQPVTILAPSNAAFAKIPYYPVIGPAWAAADSDAIRDIMKYHVIPVDVTSAVLQSTFQYYPTWLTNSSFTNVTNGQRVGGVLQNKGSTNQEMVFLSGESSRSIVTLADIPFSGGHVHVIDSLLIPPTSFPSTAEKFSTAAEPYEITSFLGATYSDGTAASSLASILNTTGDITIFAPNNVAFETVSTSLLSLSAMDLSTLLSYHIVVDGAPHYSTSFSNSSTLTALAGGALTITFSDNSYFVNSARIITSDLLISGGVMHIIDNVLSPSSPTTPPNPTLATQIPVLQTGAAHFNVSAAPFTTFLPDLTQNAVAAATSSAGDGGCYGCGGAAATSIYQGFGEPSMTPVAQGDAATISGTNLLSLLGSSGIVILMNMFYG